MRRRVTGQHFMAHHLSRLVGEIFPVDPLRVTLGGHWIHLYAVPADEHQRDPV